MLKFRLVVIIVIMFFLIIIDKIFYVGVCKFSFSYIGIKCILVFKKIMNEFLRMYIDMYFGLNILLDKMLIDVEGFFFF